MLRIHQLTVGLAILISGLSAPALAADGEIPVLHGSWMKIAEHSPDVDPYNNWEAPHNACDFTIFQATDDTWQLISCIRSTTYPGSTRLFYRWQTDDPLGGMWEPQGIFMTTDMSIHTVEGRLQAPHCFVEDDTYYFFYNNAGAFCMTSPDGLNWTHHTDYQGDYKFFNMGRDVMIFDDRTGVTGKWIAYYTDNGVEARTADSLEGPWGAEFQAASAGNPESPFVLRRPNGDYFRWSQTSVYRSADPTSFPGETATVIGPKPGISGGKYAPEIIDIDGKQYMAGYGYGIWLGELKWIPEDRPMLAKYDFEGDTLAAQTADGVSAGDMFTPVEYKGFTNNVDGRGWGGRNFRGQTAEEAITNDDYFEFTLTVDDQPLDLTMVSFFLSKQNAGATNWFLRSSLDGFAEDIDAGSVAEASYFLDLDDLPLVEDSVTFRLYCWGQGLTANHRTYIDDVQIDGLVVPEPAGGALLGLGALALLKRRRQRRRHTVGATRPGRRERCTPMKTLATTIGIIVLGLVGVTANAAVLPLEFTDGEGAQSVDRWTGTGGSGWVSSWAINPNQGANTRTVTTAAPLTGAGDAPYLTVSHVADDSTHGRQAGIQRQYDATEVPTDGPTRVRFLIRLDERTTFDASDEWFKIMDRVAMSSYNPSQQSWQVGLLGTSANWMAGDAGNLNADTGLAAVVGQTYRVTVDLDPAAAVYDLSITNMDTSDSVSLPGLGMANPAAGSFLLWQTRVVGGGGVDPTGRLDFSIDAVTVDVPEPATLVLLGLGGLAAIRRRRG